MPEAPKNATQEPAGQPKNTGLKRLWLALGYSCDGLQAAWQNEAAFRQEVMLGVMLIAVAVFLPVSLMAKALLISSVFIVLIVELLNSALEWVINYLAPQRHPLAKRIKDMASAAVFLSLVYLFIIWVLVLVQCWPCRR